MPWFWRQMVLVLLAAACAAEMPGATAVRGAEKKSKFNRVLSVGAAAPKFVDLPGVDGATHSLADYKAARAVVLVFTCNHCPVARAYEERFRQFVKDYGPRDVQFIALSISRHGADRFDKMQERARQRDFNFPYLQDLSQATGRAYGATVTPHVFVLDGQRRIAYMGAFDDHLDPEQVTKPYVTAAVEALLNGQAPEIGESLQRGCAIEYE